MTKPRHVHHLHAHAPTEEEILGWVGSRASDEQGKAVGKVEDVYRVGERLAWLLVRHRRSHHFLAPVRNAVGGADAVFLPYTRELIESAPEVEPGAEASAGTLRAAGEHYGLDPSGSEPSSSSSSPSSS